MLLHRCAELGASWCPGFKDCVCCCSGHSVEEPQVQGVAFILEQRESAHICGCEYMVHVLFLTQNNDLELVGLCFIGNVEWRLLKPIFKQTQLLSSALI